MLRIPIYGTTPIDFSAGNSADISESILNSDTLKKTNGFLRTDAVLHSLLGDMSNCALSFGTDGCTTNEDSEVSFFIYSVGLLQFIPLMFIPLAIIHLSMSVLKAGTLQGEAMAKDVDAFWHPIRITVGTVLAMPLPRHTT